MFFLLFFFSCKQKEKYRYALIESENVYSHKTLNYDSLTIADKKELDTITRALEVLKREHIIFSRSYIITLVNDKNQKWELEGNCFCLRDSINCYLIPRGEIRESYLNFLQRKFPKMLKCPISDKVEY